MVVVELGEVMYSKSIVTVVEELTQVKNLAEQEVRLFSARLMNVNKLKSLNP